MFLDVKTIDLTFPETAVPSIDTSYHCMSFHVPSEEDYHIIAVTPLVDNVHVTHHVNLLGCEIGTGSKTSHSQISHQTRYTDPMLVQCWASVADDGPALNQQWVSVSC